MVINFFIFFSLLSQVTAAGERVNHVGRILPPVPPVTQSLLFNGSQADAVLQSLQIFPPTNSWNEIITNAPLASNSAAVMSKIFTDLAQTSFRKLRFNYDMSYVIVPQNQPNLSISFVNYPTESDPSPYPIPSNMPIEGWPMGLVWNGAPWETLQQFQTDCSGDCHAIILNPNGGLWEIYTAKRTGTSWSGSNGAFFNYNTDFFRGYKTGTSTCCNQNGVPWSTSKTAGLTSADASGLSVFAGTVRYDETQRGLIEHAIRCQLRCGTGPVYPATHQANQYQGGQCTASVNDAQLGMTFRLKSSFVIPSTWTPESKTVALALKQFGCKLTDWASFFSISIAPDSRWNQAGSYGPGPFDNLSSGLTISNFELVTTSSTSGPRSPGPPVLADTADKTISGTKTTTLSATVTTSKSATLSWYTYVDTVTPKQFVSAGTATFTPSTTSIANAVTGQVYTVTVTVPVVGKYYLMISLNDGVHAVAYDVVILTVS